MRKPVIAITMGDPGGIGPEIIVKALKRIRRSSSVSFLVIGTKQPFDFLASSCKLSLAMKPVANPHRASLKGPGIHFLDVSTYAYQLYEAWHKRSNKKKRKPSFIFEIGKISQVNAAMAYAAIDVATQLALKGAVDAVVTAPLNKANIKLIKPGFTGHTEFLAKKAGVKKFAMMFVSKHLKVTLATIHVPLKAVSRMITTKLVDEKIRLTDRFLRTYFNITKPKIAVCALNPHGQETGEEDQKVILPAVRKARERKIEAIGPLSADRVFYDAYQQRYDAVLSMYHDQGLAPFKMIAFKDGVNVTLGLPFIRTSPDHGTAFDIAYQNKSDISSFQASIRLAEKLLAHP